jgi:photosystem II stability/assembly factor-like uncharacterized protein
MLSNLPQRFLLPVLVFVSFFTNAQVKPTSPDEHWKGLQKRQELQKRSVLDSVKFRNIGPSIMSGRVVDMEVNPADPTEFYVAYASGGLWYTTNNGQSFDPIFDSADIITIGDIAVNWQTRAIWVGTGEVNSSRSSYAGIGIYKSTNRGKSWNYLGLNGTHHIGKIQLDPTDENTAWVAALGHLYSPNKERGVYKTTDGGKTWKQTLFVDDNTGIADLDINPKNPKEVYAAAWYRTRKAWSFVPSGKSSGIFKSNDGGNTWTLISGPSSGFLQGDVVGRIGIAVYPKDPQIIYAVVDNQASRPDTTKNDTTRYFLNAFKELTREDFARLNDAKLDSFLRRNNLRRYTAKQVKELVETGQIKPTAIYDYLYVNTGFEGTPYGAEVYRSDNGGQTWRKTNTKPLSLFNTYGYYFGKVYVSPYNDKKVILTGFSIEMSTDGGATFKRLDKENVHADHHAAWFNPNRDSHIFSGNDGGLNISYDDGAHWFKANTPAVGQFYSVMVDNAKPYNVYGGLQDNGVWWGPSTNRENVGWHDGGDYAFKSIMGGDGMQVAVDTRDNLTTYTGFQFGNYSRLNRLSPRETAKRITPSHTLGERPFRWNWQSPVLVSRHNADIVYFGGNKLFRSFNKADTMIAVSPDLTKGDGGGNVPYGTITTIAESPLRMSLLYVGTDDGNIQVTKDAGSTWQLLNPSNTKKPGPLPQGLWISRVTASQYKEGRVYVTLNGYRNDDFNAYFFVSEDYGATWAQLGKDLPAEPLNVVREDPKNENILYIGSDGGLYVSFDRGQTFMAWNSGLPRSVPVHDIAIQQRDNEIILGTHGRSFYVSKLEDVQGLQKDKDWLKKKPKEKAEQPRRRDETPGEEEPD